MSLPVLTRTIDNAFTHTWYEIRADAIDNILTARPVTALLKSQGVFTTQVGGEFITRTILYGTKTAEHVVKGDTLPSGETELTTMARWPWTHTAVHVQRNAIDDQKNAGKFAIRKLVKTQTEAAREALSALIETTLLASIDTDQNNELRETGVPNSLFNLLPGSGFVDDSDTATWSTGGTFGSIGFGNAWWRAQYETHTQPADVNLLTDMRNLNNDCGANVSYPTAWILAQGLYEVYEDFALDKTQLVKQGKGSMLADLGFEVLQFKGRPLIWSTNMTAGTGIAINSNFLEVVYDPNMWFDPTEWKAVPHGMDRILHIMNAWQLIGTQPRRFGFLGTYT